MKLNAKELYKQAQELRRIALTMIYEAQSGHPGGAFSIADIVTALYFNEMNINPKDPKWPDRDRFVLSKGHACPIQYAALGKLGYFEEKHLHTLRKEGSILQGHPDMKKCPGIDISTGSLGQGLACGVGFSLVLFTLGSIREILGNGTWMFGAHEFLGDWAYVLEVNLISADHTYLIAILPPGGFFILAMLIAAKNALDQRKQLKKQSLAIKAKQI